mgnify:CR=1 FL=1
MEVTSQMADGAGAMAQQVVDDATAQGIDVYASVDKAMALAVKLADPATVGAMATRRLAITGALPGFNTTSGSTPAVHTASGASGTAVTWYVSMGNPPVSVGGQNSTSNPGVPTSVSMATTATSGGWG